MHRLFSAILISFLISSVLAAKNNIVTQNADGTLTYHPNSQGDILLDYSSAGYRSGSEIPSPPPVVATISPSGDDSAAIQNAVDSLARRSLNANGFRGAIKLTAGKFRLARTVEISASGIVILGSGESTIIQTDIPLAFNFEGTGKMQEERPIKFVSKYYPFGMSTFELESTSGLKVGDSIVIRTFVSEKFIQLLGMDKLVRDGKRETWIKAGSHITTDRIISRISGNQVTLDAPFPDSIRPDLFDSDADIPTLAKYTWETRLENCGIENMAGITEASEENRYGFVAFDNAINCWAKDMWFTDYNAGVATTGSNTKFITIMNMNLVYTRNTKWAAPPAVFGLEGTQNLHINSTIKGDEVVFWPLSPGGAGHRGPVVHHNIHIAAGSRANVEPHQRWSTGILYDNVYNAEGTMNLIDRSTMGSGQGWAMGWGVIWNCYARQNAVQNPKYGDATPLYHNWLIGGTGQNVPGYHASTLSGTYDSPGTPVDNPTSLYLAQMNARMQPPRQ